MTQATVAAAASRNAHGRPARTGVRAGWSALLVSAVARAVVLLIAGLLLWTVAPVAAGWSSTVVMSNSMAPRLLAGDVVLVRPLTPSELRPGQVLLVDDPDHPGRLRLHRLTAMDVDTGALTLKGDANARADSTTVRTEAVHGVAALRVPWVGSPLVWLNEGRIRLVAGTVVALAALAAGVWSYRPSTAGTSVPGTSGPATRLRQGGRGSTTLSRAVAAESRSFSGLFDRSDTQPLPAVPAELGDDRPDRDGRNSRAGRPVPSGVGLPGTVDAA